MYRVSEIKTNLLHLIGWQQNYDTQDFVIADSLTQSDSGMFFQQAHPLLTLQNLKNIAPDFNNITYDAFVNGTLYRAGSRVVYLTKKYRAKLDNINVLPTASAEDWEEFNPFTEWLENKTYASIIKAISEYTNRKLSTGNANKLLENKILFDGAGRITDVTPNQNAWAGFELVAVRSKGVTLKINKIGLQFTTAGTVTLYLMHSSSSAPIRTIECVISKPNSMQWFTQTDLFLPYVSDDVDAGGSWYLVYNQAELPVGSQAIYKDRDWSKGPCEGCSRTDYASWQAWSRYLEVHPFKVNAENVDDDLGVRLWDVQNNLYTINTNYGINLEVTVECDITDFIVAQKNIFRDIIMYQVACDLLREMAYNPSVRINRNSVNVTKADILYELDGDSASLKKSGLAYKLDLAFKAISLNTRGIDRVCLPCKNNGIKYRTA